MGQDTLKEVLEVEKQIKEMLDDETRKAQQWLEQARRETERATHAARAQLEVFVTQSEEAAEKAAEAEAAAIIREAQALAERIEALDEQALRRLVWQHIAEVGPETRHDH